MNRMMTALTCAAATAFAISLAGPAHAGTAEYTLSVTDDSSGESRRVTLECDPAGGTHPSARAACDLIAAHGGIAGVRGADDGACTMIYQPVTARATGAEVFEQTFSNACVMTSAKGAIFDF